LRFWQKRKADEDQRDEKSCDRTAVAGRMLH
jgi:hypothetical protein